MTPEPVFAASLQREVTRFSFGWLALANLVGVVLAIQLVWPQAGALLGAAGYGRLMPLHMEWHLYGWCSLPLVGLLFREYLVPGRDATADARFALAAWSAGLLVGGAGFLSASASGKLFLSWHGLSRMFFPLVLCLVWSVLATHWIRGLAGGDARRGRQALRGVLLLVLAAVPFMLFFSSARSVYPPVNPESGGATGHSLLASTLGLLGIIAAAPLLLGRRGSDKRIARFFWVAYAALWIVYLLIHHGNASNREAGQIFGLGSLLLIVPMLWIYLRRWDWPQRAHAWLTAFLCWWTMLTLNGWLTFLPGVLDRLKFTNALVAHAHLAMAGMVTCLGFVLLVSLHEPASSRRGVAGGRNAFLAWNSACLLMVLVLFLQGWREGADPAVLFGRDPLTGSLYHARLAAGIVMTLASLKWLAGALRKDFTL